MLEFTFTWLQQVISEFAPDSHTVIKPVGVRVSHLCPCIRLPVSSVNLKFLQRSDFE